MRGWLSLRAQLVASHLAVVIIALAGMTSALAVLLGSLPSPPEPVYQRLSALVQGLYARYALNALATGTLSQRELAMLIENFDQFAGENDVRVLIVLGQGEAFSVIYDSARAFNLRDQVMLAGGDYLNTRLQSVIGPASRQVYGTLSDPDGSEWLFGGVGRSGAIGQRRNLTTFFLLAEPRPTRSLQAVLTDFGPVLFRPLVQAGGIGLIVALVVAGLVSRGMVRSLAALVGGAGAIARGDYSHAVAEEGPREVRTLARAFNDMRTQVQATQESQRDFLANVSHDLKTPLTSIQGYAQAIVDGTARDPSQAAGVIHDEAERMNRMVTELTDLMRIQAGRLSLKMTELDVNALVEGIAQRLAVLARKNQLTLDVVPDEAPVIAGDGDRLVQVLTNLISNAIKFTPPGGRITVRTGTRDGGVFIHVQDTGIGIAAADLPRIFERFYQVDKARGPQRGTGLGLAITREIVEAHGGTIQVHSLGEGKGSTFSIWLPSPQLSTIIRRR